MTSEATALAELAWLTQAPPLLHVPPGIQDGGTLLGALGSHPQRLQRAAETLADTASPRRLGHHFENLVAAALVHSERFEVVARNVILRHQGITLGELDMLVRDRFDGALCHWELALKFYLGLPGMPEPQAWPGPDPRDQLLLKTNHLYHRQLKRSLEPVVISLLAERGWHVQRRVLLTRGRLFYPTPETLAAPSVAAVDHQRGLWWRRANVPDSGRLIPHHLWHTPALSDTRTACLAGPVLRDYVDRQASPVMLATASNQIGFLVPDHWPTPTGVRPA